MYSASGFNKGKDKLKTSFHLVWPQLVVDSDSAPWLREITLMIFSALEASAGSGVSVGTDPAMAVGYGSRWHVEMKPPIFRWFWCAKSILGLNIFDP